MVSVTRKLHQSSSPGRDSARGAYRRVAWRLRPSWFAVFAGVIACCAARPTTCAAQDPAAPEQVERTIYVPFDDLPVLLNGPNERVFMTREEYQQLQAEAAQKPPTPAPQPTVLLSAAYEATIQENVAKIRGQIDIEVLEPGLHSVPLPLQGVAVHSAILDGKTAPVARTADGQVVLFLREQGTHRLELELHSPVIVAAAQQNLQLRLPDAGSATLIVLVPGNVEVKSGASVVQRQYDQATDQTRFELVFTNEPLSLVMSLNNRRLRQGRVVAARMVLVSELTTAYERLHVTAHMNVLHATVDRFLFDVPAGFQITGVSSPLLSQWIIRQEAEQEVLEVTLREPVRGTETLNISASRTPVTLGQWTMPQLKPRDVAGQVAVVGLLAESRLRPLELHSDNLIHLDTSVLRGALPPSIFQTEPGAPAIRQIAAYYAPGENYALTAALEDPPDELRVATHLLLSLDEERQTLRGGFTLTPQATKLTAFAFQLPADWQLEQLSGADQKPLAFDRYRTDDNTRYVVQLPISIEPGSNQTIFFVAHYRSAAWLSEWNSTQLEFPRVRVERATDSSGAIAIQANGDLTAKPETTNGLAPLDSKERSRFGLADSSNELTYQVTGEDYQATFLVQRRQPRISTRNYSFFQVKDGVLVAHCEVVFIIERAHANRLQLELPDSTPTSLSIRGLDNVQLKEFSHVTRDGKNLWTVLLAKAETDTVRLAIDFEQRLADPEPKDFVLPVARTAGVAYQTQMVTIEGDPALDIDIQTTMRRVDVGELAEAQYTPGRRLLGAFASTDDGENVQISVARRELRPLPSAIVKRAELVTLISSAGLSQSSARYLLQTKVPFLAIQLPADTELWSVSLNGKPIKPRRRGDQILLSLQTENPDENRDLQVVYQTPIAHLSWLGDVSTHAPQLWLALDEQNQGTPVPQVDLIWYVHLPTGYSASRVRGTVFSSDVQRPESPLKALAKAAVAAGGGVYGPPTMMMAARESRRARREVASSAYYLSDDVQYEAARRIEGPLSQTGPVTFDMDQSSSVRDESVQNDGRERLWKRNLAGERSQVTDNFAAGQGEQRYSLSAQPQGAGMGMGMGPTDGQPNFGMMGAGASPGMGGYPGMSGAAGPPPPSAQPGGGMGGGMGGMPGMGSGGAMYGAAAVPRQPTSATTDRLDSGALVAGAQIAPPAVPQSGEYIAPVESTVDPMIGKYWALQGLRGLEIRIDESGERLAFQSLGTDPLLDMTVFQQSRMNWLSTAVALAVLVVGLLLSRSKLRTRVWFVAVVAIVACGLPLLGGPTTEFAKVCEQALLAALALIPIWVLIAVASRLTSWITRKLASPSVVVSSLIALAAISLSALSSQAQAQDLTELLKPLLEESKPVLIPEDAVVIPYDANDVAGRSNVTKVLVPYRRYEELWNAAHPDQKIGPSAVDQEFSFAGAEYETVLGDEDQIVLKGTLYVELFTDQPVDVPLALQDGVITSALLDGKPARLKANVPQPAPNPAPQQAVQQTENAPTAAQGSAILALLVEGKGRHQLELSVRVAVARQGGWRTARAVIPYAEATGIRLTVPTVGTTVRRPLGETQLTETTPADAQTIETTLQPGGQFEVTWRGKISPGSVDQALTAASAALIDVREDGVRVAWQVNLTFGQTERGMFRLAVPSDYLVEKVDGKNVRGWDTQQEGEQTLLTVELLKAVKQNEEMIVHLSRRTAVLSAAQNTLIAPFVTVPDAALHRGVVQIRRSPILELQTTDTAGVSRADGGAITQQLDPQLSELQSPLGIRDYQAYEFNATPFRVAMVASQIAPRVTAQLRTIFRIGETESALESEITLSPQRREIYAVEVALPADLKLEQVTAAGLTDWSLVTVDDRLVLRAFFSAGQAGTFPLSIRGKLRDHTANEPIDLPQLEVLNVDQQRGSIAVQVDPSLDARATDLQQCQSVLLDRVAPWLNDEQRSLARIALEYQNEPYAGKIQVTPREPRVVCNSVTNVRVTYREIQETILLDFRIMEAGIRQVTFRLPASLKDANISALRLRQKSITPVEGEDYVRVQLDLQDAITGDYRVVIENDRAITPGRQTAPLPLIDLGTVNNRYVTLENAGRDEIVIDGTPGMESVNRSSRQWEQLAARLRGGDFATAYVTTKTDATAEFGYQTKQRAMVSTAGATIGLARTELVLDASGAYRASMSLKVDNRTEPYLEIRLPENAQLWTAHVASRPVKPARSVGSQDDSLLRIPLIKTAEGDLDYPVVLKYAGKFDGLSVLTPVQFPIISTENIHIELSQVKLYLPEDYHWYQFDGSATRVLGEEDFVAGYVAYQTLQVEKLTQIIRDSNEFSKSRAVSNVKRLGEELQQLQSDNGRGVTNEQLRMNLDSNASVLEAATQEIKELEDQDFQVTDNRERLNTFFEQQQNGLSRNSVTRLGGNFMIEIEPPASAQPAAAGKDSATKFDQNWFGREAQQTPAEEAEKSGEDAKGKTAAPGKKRLQQEESFRVQQQMKMPEEQDAAKQVFQAQPGSQEGVVDDQRQARFRSRGLGTKSELNRAYMDKIAQQAVQGVEEMEDGGQQGQQQAPQVEAPAAGVADGSIQTDFAISGVVAPQGLAGLASLDFELPQRGQMFYFTTPRGKVTITARPLRSELRERLVNAMWLLGMVLALLLIVVVVRRLTCSRTGRIVSVIILCGIGLLMVVMLTFPLFGLAMFFGGILLAVDRWQQPSTPAAS